MQYFPNLYRKLVTKQEAELCRTNLQLPYHNQSHSSICPSCNSNIESTMYINCCPDFTKAKLFKLLVQEVCSCSWLSKNFIEFVMVEIIEEYRLARGVRTKWIV